MSLLRTAISRLGSRAVFARSAAPLRPRVVTPAGEEWLFYVARWRACIKNYWVA